VRKFRKIKFFDFTPRSIKGIRAEVAPDIPMLHVNFRKDYFQLAVDPYGIYALILTPTRELAFQIAEQFTALGKPIGIQVAIIVGGRHQMAQALDLTKWVLFLFTEYIKNWIFSCFFDPKFFFKNSKNESYRDNFMRRIDCAHSRNLKVLP
jgi:hypothetical protein